MEKPKSGVARSILLNLIAGKKKKCIYYNDQDCEKYPIWVNQVFQKKSKKKEKI